MKAIMVMFDSLNRHMLPPYGDKITYAPNFKRLAEHSVTFDSCFVGSMPCMPARRELHTGRLNFLHRSWSPLEPFDDSMPEMLKENGVYSHLITDHYHYFENGGASYHTRYSTWESVRGQEGDPWKASVASPFIPETVGGRDNCLWRQDWVNRPYMQGIEKHPQKKVFDLGLEFIEKNKDEDNWYLQLEAFDPHEPFFVPEEFDSLYPEDYQGSHFDWPNYTMVSETEEQKAHLIRKYRRLVSFCDWNLGRILDKMDEYDLWKDTLLIVNTDHGFLLGEHDWWAKCRMPFYNEIAHIPLFIWDPRLCLKDVRRASLVQTIDIAPTVLDFFGIRPAGDMQGRILYPVLQSDTRIHDAVLFGIHGGHVNITDGRYVYMRAPARKDNTPLFNYTLMPMHMRERFSLKELQSMTAHAPFEFTKGCQVWKVPSAGIPELDIDSYRFGTMLFDTKIDPCQQGSVSDEKTENHLIHEMIRLMKENDAPLEQYERLGLVDYFNDEE